MNLIFVMSISGSLAFLIYLLMKPVTNRFMTARWQYNFLKICLLLYLIPYQYFQDAYLRFYNRNWGNGRDINPLREDFLVFKEKNTIYITPDGKLHYEYGLQFFVCCIVWLLLISAFLCFQLINYYFFRKKLLVLSYVPEQNTTYSNQTGQNTILSSLVKRTKILQCDFIQSPLAIGIRKPIVILPSQNNEEDSSLYLAHELSHVKNYDAVWKFIAFTAILLHCLNPLIYYLFFELRRVIELNCDETVTASLNNTAKQRYGDLIIQAAQTEHNITARPLLVDTFSNSNKKHIKERILFMTRKKHKNSHWKLFTALAVCLTVLSMPVSVLAYEPFYTYEIDEYDSPIDVMYIVPAGTETPLTDNYCNNLDFTLSDELLIDESGNQHAITDADRQATASCSHKYVKQTKSYHSKSGSSCTVSTYEGTYCEKCGHCSQQTLISQTYYPTCPH